MRERGQCGAAEGGGGKEWMQNGWRVGNNVEKQRGNDRKRRYQSAEGGGAVRNGCGAGNTDRLRGRSGGGGDVERLVRD